MKKSSQKAGNWSHRLGNALAPLSHSFTTLLMMASLCAVLAVCLLVRVAFLRPGPSQAVALRKIVIPEAAVSNYKDGYQYRYFISQIVQQHGSSNFYEGRDLSDLIIRVSLEENIDPLFVAAVVKAESTFRNTAVSNRGARGLMQIRSGTAEYISNLIDQPWHGERFLHDPEYNLRLGIAYLKYLSRKFDGSVEKVLAAYNWGPGNLKKSGSSLANAPTITQKYVGTILRNHKRWRDQLSQQRAALEVDFSEQSA